MALDCIDLTHDGLEVDTVLISRLSRFLPRYETQEIRLVSMKIRVAELPDLRFCLRECVVVDMRNLVKAVH